MQTSEITRNEDGEYVKDGRVFKPLHKNLLDRMPKDLVQEMARRKLAELEAQDKEIAEIAKNYSSKL